MNGKQALEAARKVLGPRALVRRSATPSSPEKRAKAQQDYQQCKALADELDAQIAAEVARLTAHLQPKRERVKELRKQADEARSQARYYAISVGVNTGFCVSIKAQGDDFADALQKVNA